MADFHPIMLLWTALFFLLHLLVGVRALLRRHRSPASRLAWVVVILAMPALGILAYLLLGETSVGRRRTEKTRDAEAGLPDPSTVGVAAKLPEDEESSFGHLFRLGSTVNGFQPVVGNRAELMADSNAAIDAMIRDIDAAADHVHLAFYIWLADQNGLRMVEALKRATSRGVICRAMADSLGSRDLIRSVHWAEMKQAGVRAVETLRIGNPLLRPLRGRLDLRNHRKILVVDNEVTYCGSQNCADPEFRIKAKYAPWVDLMVRFEGPVVRQNQYLFATDWMSEVVEDLSFLFRDPPKPAPEGFPAQVIGTGPTIRPSAMPEVFGALLASARHEIVITTPYFVPDEAMQAALCACARRGVRTILVLPARNDSFIVAAASRSYYTDLLEAGVELFEYDGGLLHTKSLTLDGKISLIGSANMDRRSFDLNYENNILLLDAVTTAKLYARQQAYLEHSHRVDASTVEAWSVYRRFWNNALAMLGPIL